MENKKDNNPQKTLLARRMRFNRGWHDGMDGHYFAADLATASDPHYSAGFRIGVADRKARKPHGTSAAAWAQHAAEGVAVTAEVV